MLRNVTDKQLKPTESGGSLEADAALAAARTLVRPGAVFGPGEQRTIASAATAIEARGGPRDDVDRNVLAQAERLAFYGPTRDPEVEIPKALRDRIAGFEAKCAAKVAAAGQLLEALVTARKAVTSAKTEEEEQRATAEVRRVETNYNSACSPDADTVELARLLQQRESFKRAASVRAHATPLR